MKVFISWSGDKSKEVAELLDEWLQCVLQAVDPWMSSKDIDKGSLWFSEISDQLKDTSIGIICLTQSNKEKPWILFEAGALAKGLSSSRVCTFLIDLKPTDLGDPLAQFNHTLPDQEGIWNLVRTLNAVLGDKSLKEKILENVFNTYWPQFNERFNEIISHVSEKAQMVKRTNDDILIELLSVTRSLEKRIRTIETIKSPDRKLISKRISPEIAEKIIADMIERELTTNHIIDFLDEFDVPKGWIIDKIKSYKKESSKKLDEVTIKL